MTTGPNPKVQEIIQKAKSVPIQAYLLLVLNIIMLNAFVCQELPLPYVLGMVAFTVLLVTAIGKLTNFWPTPTHIIDESIQRRVKQVEQKLISYAKSLRTAQLESKSINTIVTLLLIIYISSQLNGTLEIFLIVNIVYSFVFLPKQTDQLLECGTHCLGEVVSKISYKQQLIDLN